MPAAAEPRPAFTQFSEGLDQETPAWVVPAGRLRDALNYEIAVQGGYQDITGYERFDGRTSPSAASFTILDVTITGSIEVGDTVTGATSTATGLVIAKSTYPDDASQTYLVLTKVTGTFDESNENLTVSAVVEGNTDAEGYADAAPTNKLKAQYSNLAADEYRSDIQALSGEGSVWGVFMLGDDTYAIRNKTGGATAGLYKATSSGWSEIDLGRYLYFTSGSTEIEEGDTITGHTSGATAEVKRIQVISGTWAGGDATGYITLGTSQTGTFQAETLDVGATLDVASSTQNSIAHTLQPDGKLDFDVSNFANPQGDSRVYGADGVNQAWEFDGTVFAWLHTGMSPDTPDHVIEHKKQLILSFDGSIQNSGLGDPFSWSVVTGASEIATSSPVTGFQTQPGAEGNAALLVACRGRLYVLYGNDSSDWNLVPYRGHQQVGAYEWTLQTLAQTIFLDDRGITSLATTQAFGNFSSAAFSSRIRDLVKEKRSLAVASCVVRDKNQYRLFFSDETAIYVTLDGSRVMGMMPVKLDDQPVVVCSQEDSSGNEQVFFGCDDGYVYQMEKGTSFDGDNIYAYLQTHYDHVNAIGWTKEFFGPVSIEAKGSGYAELNLTYKLDYGGASVNQPESQTEEVSLGDGSMWDTGLVWDTGESYDDASLAPAVAFDLRGEGRNISWLVTKDSDYFSPLLLSGVHFRYVNRAPVRG